MNARGISKEPLQVGIADGMANRLRWFCVQTHPKQEHIAAARLAKVCGFEAFNPRFRTRKATTRGLVWFILSAFPGYIFVRFDLERDLPTVRFSSFVSKVVHFNSGYPSIPDSQINELRSIFTINEIITVSQEFAAGDKVRIVGGAFHDLIAVVQQVKPARQRVQALLDFLGQSTMVELEIQDVTVEERVQPALHPLSRTHALVEGGTGRAS